jgi:hypothetical protein
MAAGAPSVARAQGLYPSPAAAPTVQGQAEENFRQVFVVAAYSSAFGAALGASVLPFMGQPSMTSLRYVLGGASLGFVAGAAYGFYLVSTSGHGQAAPYGYDPYATMRDLGPEERRVVYETMGQTSQPMLSIPAYQSRW